MICSRIFKKIRIFLLIPRNRIPPVLGSGVLILISEQKNTSPCGISANGAPQAPRRAALGGHISLPAPVVYPSKSGREVGGKEGRERAGGVLIASSEQRDRVECTFSPNGAAQAPRRSVWPAFARSPGRLRRRSSGSSPTA